MLSLKVRISDRVIPGFFVEVNYVAGIFYRHRSGFGY